MDVEYILYEVLLFMPYEGWDYPIRTTNYDNAIKFFESACSGISKGYDHVWLEGIDKDGNATELKYY